MKIEEKPPGLYFALAFLLLSLLLVLTLGGVFAPQALSFFQQEKSTNYSKFQNILNLLTKDSNQAAFELENFLKFQGLSSREKSLGHYVLARLREKENRLQEALDHYRKIDLNQIKKLKVRVYLHRAEIQTKLGNEKAVLENCQKIIHNHPRSISLPAAYYELARSLIRQSDWSKAQKELKILNEQFPETNYGIATNYYLGMIAEKNSQFAVRDTLWENYLKASPKGHFSSIIVQSWLEEENRDLQQKKLSPKQKELIGLNLYHQGNQLESWKFLEKNWSKRSWKERARLLLLAKRKSEAKNFLFEQLKRFSRDRRDFREGVSLLFRNISYPEIKELLVPLVNASPSSERDFLLWQASRFAQNQSEKFKYYRAISTNSLNKEKRFLVLSLRALFWQAFQRKDLIKTKEYAQRILEIDPSGESAAKVRFWLGKEQEKKEPLKAKLLYQDLLKNNSHSYYAYRAKERLAELEKNRKGAKNWQAKNFASRGKSLEKILQKKEIHQLDCPLPREYLETEEGKTLNPVIRELLYLNLWQEARSLLSQEERKKHEPLDIWITCRLEEQRATSIYKAYRRIANKQLLFQEESSTWLSAYPFAYLLASVQASSKRDLDPLLLLALVRQESRFQKSVVSRSGATGLSQLMPATAREIASSLGLSFQKEKLKEPEYNLELGAFYLRQMLNSFQRLEFAIASYNAGPGNVSRWLKNSSKEILNDPDLFIESIPFEETKNYVLQVLENYWIYENLFSLEHKNSLAENKQ